MSVRRWAAGLAVLAVLMGGAVVTVLVVQVHQNFGEWGLSPSARPPKLVVGGRDYRRSTTAGRIAPEDVLLDHVAGGELYGPRSTDVPTVLELKTPDGVAAYELVGGP